MLLAAPSPIPSPIVINVPPDTTLQQLTLALVIVTGILALATFGLAIAGIWQARSTAVGVHLQRHEMAAVERQLNLVDRQVALAEEQAQAAREAARPKLRAEMTSVGQLYVNGVVNYLHGTDPAEEIEVWIRGEPREGATWGLYFAQVGFMVPVDRQREFMASPATDQQQDRLPFLDFLDGNLGGATSWSMVTWRRPDGTLDYRAEQQFAGKPPRPLELKRPTQPG